jgi:hypothetical protein
MWILHFRRFIDRFTLRQQSAIFTSVPLPWRDVTDTTVTMCFVIPANEAFYPRLRILQRREV